MTDLTSEERDLFEFVVDILKEGSLSPGDGLPVGEYSYLGMLNQLFREFAMKPCKILVGTRNVYGYVVDVTNQFGVHGFTVLGHDNKEYFARKPDFNVVECGPGLEVSLALPN